MFKKIVVSYFLVTIFSFVSTYGQCAMCKAVVENGDESMAEGVNDGIAYLMVFPYLLIGVLFYSIYKYNKSLKN